jgi:maleate isomerase
MGGTGRTADEGPAAPEYGTVLGILTPQANTTVEPEMHALLGGAAGYSVITARLTSAAADSRARLVDYFDRLEATLAQFDVAPLAAAGFACTGSAYLVGRADEEKRLAAASRAAGYPVLSAAQAILAVLAELGAKRIALVSPYPQWLTAAAERYWRDAGIALAGVAAMPEELADTRGIYRLTTARVQALVAGLDVRGADAVLLSGTGMPTLRTIASAAPGLPVVSSNLCLARLLERSAGGARPLERWLAADAPWRGRLAS